MFTIHYDEPFDLLPYIPSRCCPFIQKKLFRSCFKFDMTCFIYHSSDFKPAFSMGKIFDAVVGKTETPGPSYYTVPPAIGCHPTNHFGPHPMIHSSFRFKFPTARRYDPSCERPGPGPGAYDLIDERKRPDIPWTAKYSEFLICV